MAERRKAKGKMAEKKKANRKKVARKKPKPKRKPRKTRLNTDVIFERIIASVFDSIIILVILGVAVLMGIVGGWGTIIASFLVMLVIVFFYTFLLEGYKGKGQTIGKMILDIKVVMEDGSPCNYSASFVRNLIRIIDRLPCFYIIGFVSIAISDKNQRLGDRLAETVVVKCK